MTEEGFRRYTNLASAIHLLRTQSISLLNPATWDDKNDAYFMVEYKRHKKAQTVLALCFAERPETYHHWRVFSHGADGVRIDFNKERLLSTFAGDKRVRHGPVHYAELAEVRRMTTVDAERLPFLKRYPYQDEGEYRVLYVDTEQAEEVVSYDIRISWIRKITLSPWMPDALAKSVKALLKTIDRCSEVPVVHSTLVNNEDWKSLASRVGTATTTRVRLSKARSGRPSSGLGSRAK